MDAKQTVHRAVLGPAHRGWKTVEPRLPAGVATPIRRAGKKVVRWTTGAAARDVVSGSTPRPSRGPLAVVATWPGIAEPRDDALRQLLFSALLGPGEGRRLLDLGAGPCLFARIGRDLGWAVTAVDGRTERLPDDLEGITFIEADVRGYDTSGFDTIAILGLLYHLTLPEQEALLRSCVGTRVILETQVHTAGYVPPAAEPWGNAVVEVDGLRGVVFPEGNNPMASIGNASSLWLTDESLLDLVGKVGFTRAEVIEPAHHSKYGTRRFVVLDT